MEIFGIIIIFLGFLRSREVFGLYRFPLVHGFARVAESNPPATTKPEEKK
ncbi:MAG: hypothetical protein HY667_01305, partial [Chloroflexi bacterium]|nr:hypothetical protein [Chloroflexota bacterium]